MARCRRKVPSSASSTSSPISAITDSKCTELSAEAAVALEPEGQGFRITRSALTLRAKVPNLGEADFARIAKDAEENCPVSKVLKAEITLDAKLV